MDFSKSCSFKNKVNSIFFLIPSMLKTCISLTNVSNKINNQNFP